MSKRTKPTVALLAGLLLATSVMARSGLSSPERAITFLLFRLPDFLLPVFKLITLLGTLWTLVITVILMAFFRKYRLAVRVAMAGALAAVAATLLKQLISRPRPNELYGALASRGFFETGYGFPSAHAAVATAIAFSITPVLDRRQRQLAWLLVGLVCLSRIYLGVHAPLDIVGGVCVGLLAGMAVRSIRRIFPRSTVK